MPPHWAKICEPEGTRLMEESKIGAFHQIFGYTDEISYFLECLRHDRKVEINNIDEAVKNMKLLQTLREHANQGMVQVPG
jgi:hypothetical protein